MEIITERKYNSKWWTDQEIEEILKRIENYVTKTGYNHFTTHDITTLANLGPVQSRPSTRPGIPKRTKKLQSLIHSLMGKTLIKSLGSSLSFGEGTHYCLTNKAPID